MGGQDQMAFGMFMNVITSGCLRWPAKTRVASRDFSGWTYCLFRQVHTLKLVSNSFKNQNAQMLFLQPSNEINCQDYVWVLVCGAKGTTACPQVFSSNLPMGFQGFYSPFCVLKALLVQHFTKTVGLGKVVLGVPHWHKNKDQSKKNEFSGINYYKRPCVKSNSSLRTWLNSL